MKTAIKSFAIVLIASLMAGGLTGCSATKVEFDKKIEGDKTEISYSIWHNDHWMKTEAERMGGGMTEAGVFNFEAAGTKSSPSEEFNRTMQTYTTAFVQLAQIAAAAYNPSASQAVSSAAKSTSATTTPTVVVNTQQAEASAAAASKEKEAAASPAAASAQTAAECKDCTVSSDAARTSAIAK